MEEHEQHTHGIPRHRHQRSSGSATEQPSRPRLRGLLLDPDGMGIGLRQAKSEEGSTSARFGGLGSGAEVSAVLALFFIALWAFWRYIVRRQLIATGTEDEHSRLTKKEPDSGSTSAGSLRREELDPRPLVNLENQGSTDFRGDFIAVRYEESVSIRQGGSASTGSGKQREEAKASQSSDKHRGAGEDIEDGGNMSSYPPSIDEVLQRSVRGFREPWWTATATGADETREDEVNANLGTIESCPLQPETKAFLCDHVGSCPSSRRMSAVPEDMCLLGSPSSANATDVYVFGEETKDEETGSEMLRSMAGISLGVTSTPGSMQRGMLYQTLSLASEELVLPLQAGSSLRHSEAFDDQAAGMETVQLVDEASRGECDFIADGEDGHPVSIMSDARRFRVGSTEQEENLPLLLVSPFVESPVQEVAGPPSMTSRLVGILHGVSNLKTAIRGTFLARNCSLSRSEENGDLQWDRTLGAGKYGRVTLVHHELGPFAVKELTEEANDDDRIYALNEMETFLSVGDNPNIIRVFAMDSTIPTMPIMMEAGIGDMFDIVGNDGISMQGKTRLLHDAACGIHHMHSKGKVHRDIKAGNIVVVGGPEEETLAAKLADFGLTCDAGTITPATTGTPGYVPVENLRCAIESGPEGDVFSFAVLMLLVFLLPEFRANNVFANALLYIDGEPLQLEDVRGDALEEFRFECRVMERTLVDGSFEETILVPEKLQDSVPDKEAVCQWLRCCLAPERELRPTMEEVAGMLEELMA